MSFNFLPGQGETESSSAVDLRRRLAAAMLQQGMQTSPIQSPWQGVARLSEALMGGLAVRRQAQQEQESLKQGMAALTGQPYTPPAETGGFLSRLFGNNDVPATSAQNQISASSPAATSAPASASAGNVSAPDLSGNDVYNGFMDTVKGGVKNPYALAAIASTGKAESGFSPKNSSGVWNDGVNNAGGIMSWNGPRLAALQKFSGGSNGTPQQQAAFFLQENPDLIGALNNAKSVDEAQHLMNNAWAFKGYNVPGNANAANRLATARAFLPGFLQAPGTPAPQANATGTSPTQVASLDPSAGMASAMPAPAAQPIVPPPSPTAQPGNMASVTPDQMQAMLGPTPTPGYQDPTVTTAYREAPPTTPAAQAIAQQAPDPMQMASLGPNPGMPAQTSAQSPTPTAAPVAPQAAASAPDQSAPRTQLAQAMMNAPGTGAPNALASNPRAQALAAAMMNPYAPPQLRSLLGAALQTQMQPHTQIVQNPNTGATYLVDTWTGAKQLIDQGQTADSELQKDANGNPIGVFNKRTGEYQKMGDPTAQLDIVTRPDGSIIAVNKITGQQMAAPAGAMKTDSIVEGPVDPQTGYPTKLLYNPVDGVKGVIGPNGQLLPPGSQQAPAQAGNAPVPPPGVDPKKYRETMATRAAEAATPSAKDENEFASSMMARPSYKEYSAAVPTWNSFTQHIQDNTPAADKAIVDDFAKILNPGRAVTTGSFQLNMDAQSVPEYLQGQILKAFTGNGELGPDARAQMAKIAQLKMQEYQKAWNIDAQQGTKIAKSHGLTVENVIPEVPGVDSIDFSKVNSLKTTAAGTGPATAAPSTAAPAATPTAMPTATGPNGEKIQWNGSAWVPLSGPTVNPNSNINRVPTGN
ncbi:hypothetical protein G6M50_38065 [Agrobacterium rhizogenes]|nr:hypothetical protein [Rhizobium rhizogenes]NTJ83597.1 hypothetical protein [Rhizobium rhizogenes]